MKRNKGRILFSSSRLFAKCVYLLLVIFMLDAIVRLDWSNRA